MKEEIVKCNANGARLKSEPWQPGVPVSIMWMPAGVHTICAGFRKGSIELTVQCTEETADAVQASLEQWRNERPKQESFACIEHRETEASFRVSASCGFKWNNDGVYLSAEPTVLGAQNVNGKVHRSWSPSFTTDADYSKATEHDGVLQFPEGVRGSRSNPARITGVDFCVGTLTNKPAFHSMSPVRSREAVMASGTSEGAKKGWEAKHGGWQNLAPDVHILQTDKGMYSTVNSFESGHHLQVRDGKGKVDHLGIHETLEGARNKAKAHYESGGLKASDTTSASTITAHCKENLLRDVPDATKAEVAQYEKLIDDGGSHGDAVYEIRKDRKNGFVSSQEKPTLDSIYGKVNASLTTANRLAEENGVCKLTAAEVYERHSVKSIYARAGANR